MEIFTTFLCPDSTISFKGERIFAANLIVNYQSVGKELAGTLLDPPEHQEIFIEDIRIASINESDESFSEDEMEVILKEIEKRWGTDLYRKIKSNCKDHYNSWDEGLFMEPDDEDYFNDKHFY